VLVPLLGTIGPPADPVLGPQEGPMLVALLVTIGPPAGQVLGPKEGQVFVPCWPPFNPVLGQCRFPCWLLLDLLLTRCWALKKGHCLSPAWHYWTSF
jgi:hypothetical protein